MGWPNTKKKEAKSVNSSVDLNTPVENPSLKTAINDYKANRNLKTQNNLGEALNSAQYLVAIITDEITTTPSELEGQVTIEKGSVIKILNCFNENNESFLPVFTDWEEIRMWTSQKVATLVMPAAHLWGFALQDNQYAGVVINPAGTPWSLSKDNIIALQADKKQ